LNTLNIPIIVTGARSDIDLRIKSELPKLDNLYDFINETSLDELFALSDKSLCYIGMDTLNMHIASSQNKKIFAIFGPTITSMWRPWSNGNSDNIKIFQANMSCINCGKAGCDNKHGKSECLDNIEPKLIFDEVKKFLDSAK
jgi:heptosyltransferase-3